MEMKVTYYIGTHGYTSISSLMYIVDCLDWTNATIDAMKVRGIDGPYHELYVLVMSMGFVAIKAYLTETFQILLESVPPEGHPGETATFGAEKISIRVEW